MVIGWVGGRTEAVGALLLAAHDQAGRLAYAGSVSSGLSRMAKRSLYEQLLVLETPMSPLPGEQGLQAIGHVRWARPQLAPQNG